MKLCRPCSQSAPAALFFRPHLNAAGIALTKVRRRIKQLHGRTGKGQSRRVEEIAGWWASLQPDCEANSVARQKSIGSDESGTPHTISGDAQPTRLQLAEWTFQNLSPTMTAVFVSDILRVLCREDVPALQDIDPTSGQATGVSKGIRGWARGRGLISLATIQPEYKMDCCSVWLGCL